MRLHNEYGYRFKAFFDNNQKSEHIEGNYESIKDYVLANEIHEIYCCLPYVEYGHIKELIDFGDELHVKIEHR